MKAQYSGKHRGVSTLEILIAFAILTLTLTAVIVVVFGNQSIAIDTQTNIEAISKAKEQLEVARALSREDFNAVNTIPTYTWTPAGSPLSYTASTTILDISECKKIASSTVTWAAGGRRLYVDFATMLTSPSVRVESGNDCPVDTTEKKWDQPQRFAFDNLNPGKTTAIDVLGGIAYLGTDKKPFLAIADTRGAHLDQNSAQPMFLTFTNSFNSSGKVIDQINDLDVFEDPSGKRYVIAALASSTAQFGVIDVSDGLQPKLVALRKLNAVVSSGSHPNGYRVFYSKGRAYIVTKETDGPELHVFDMSTPTNPNEIGKKEINTTANDFSVRDGLLYMADDSDLNGEVRVYDVSVPGTISEIAGAQTDLPGNADSESLYLLGAKLYVGRATTAGGPELYVLDVLDPFSASGGLKILGKPQEINGDVLGIRVLGKIVFLISSRTNEEFQVWNVSPYAVFTLVKKYNFGNVVAGGLDYEPDFVYSTGDATPNFQILYSPT